MYKPPQRTTLDPINTVRRRIICLLIMALPLSFQAGAAAPCVQENEPSTAQETVIDAGTRYGRIHHVSHSQTQDRQEIVSDHHVVQGEDSAPADCRCCDDCATTCVLSGCNPAAITSVSPELSLGRDDPGIPLADAIHVSPTPHSLFRPPISIA